MSYVVPFDWPIYLDDGFGTRSLPAGNYELVDLAAAMTTAMNAPLTSSPGYDVHIYGGEAGNRIKVPQWLITPSTRTTPNPNPVRWPPGDALFAVLGFGIGTSLEPTPDNVPSYVVGDAPPYRVYGDATPILYEWPDAGYTQEFYDWSVAAMPDWYADEARSNEFLHAAARIFGAAKAVGVDWLTRQTRILLASGGADDGGGIDFLSQHARDRGTYRQAGETSDALRERLRSVPDNAITPESMAELVDGMLEAGGVTGTSAIVELTARDGAYLGSYTSQTGTGGTFALASGALVFTPSAGFIGVPEAGWHLVVTGAAAGGNNGDFVVTGTGGTFALASGALVFTPSAGFIGVPEAGWHLVVTGAAAGGNNGDFVVTGTLLDGAKYVNASGVAGADATAHWTLKKYIGTNLVDGYARSYATRGYRASGMLSETIVILPYGTTEELAAAIAETLRLKRPAGSRVVIERRLVP